MPTAACNGITIDYEVRGDAGQPVILAIMGLGSQRVLWPPELLDGLAGRGFQVVTFDNRDAGRSTIFSDAPVSGSAIAAAISGMPFDPPYTLNDMAADAVGLLDHLRVDAAHVVGASMGGMIAQHLAFSWPHRVKTLTSIMSTTGKKAVGVATAEASAVLFSQPPTQRERYIDDFVARRRVLGSPSLFDEGRARAVAAVVFDRGLQPAGTARQLLAIYADRDRTSRLAGITAPTLVIHGRQDPLITLSGGEATAAAIDGAKLVVFDEMGHDLPLPLIPPLVDAIADHAHGTGRRERVA